MTHADLRAHLRVVEHQIEQARQEAKGRPEARRLLRNLQRERRSIRAALGLKSSDRS